MNHNHTHPNGTGYKCSCQNGVGGGHTHNIQPNDIQHGNQLSVLLDDKDFALFFRHNRNKIYLASGKLRNNWIPSEIPLETSETIEYCAEMISRVIVGVDINMFIEGIRIELMEVINKKLVDLKLIEEGN